MVNYIPEKLKFSGILCFHQQRSRRRMAAGGHFVKNIRKKKLRIAMARNAIESYLRTSKMADQSEMARNAIQSDFQTSKMAAKKNYVAI